MGMWLLLQPPHHAPRPTVVLIATQHINSVWNIAGRGWGDEVGAAQLRNDPKKYHLIIPRPSETKTTESKPNGIISNFKACTWQKKLELKLKGHPTGRESSFAYYTTPTGKYPRFIKHSQIQ